MGPKPAMPIGYAQNHKAYKQLDFETGEVIASENVVFDELSTGALDTHGDSCRIERTIHNSRWSHKQSPMTVIVTVPLCS